MNEQLKQDTINQLKNFLKNLEPQMAKVDYNKLKHFIGINYFNSVFIFIDTLRIQYPNIFREVKQQLADQPAIKNSCLASEFFAEIPAGIHRVELSKELDAIVFADVSSEHVPTFLQILASLYIYSTSLSAVAKNLLRDNYIVFHLIKIINEFSKEHSGAYAFEILAAIDKTIVSKPEFSYGILCTVSSQESFYKEFLLNLFKAPAIPAETKVAFCNKERSLAVIGKSIFYRIFTKHARAFSAFIELGSASKGNIALVASASAGSSSKSSSAKQSSNAKEGASPSSSPQVSRNWLIQIILPVANSLISFKLTEASFLPGTASPPLPVVKVGEKRKTPDTPIFTELQPATKQRLTSSAASLPSYQPPTARKGMSGSATGILQALNTASQSQIYSSTAPTKPILSDPLSSIGYSPSAVTTTISASQRANTPISPLNLGQANNSIPAVTAPKTADKNIQAGTSVETLNTIPAVNPAEYRQMQHELNAEQQRCIALEKANQDLRQQLTELQEQYQQLLQRNSNNNAMFSALFPLADRLQAALDNIGSSSSGDSTTPSISKQ
jgi:hypothetical protein